MKNGENRFLAKLGKSLQAALAAEAVLVYYYPGN